jgi:hypothetical protein
MIITRLENHDRGKMHQIFLAASDDFSDMLDMMPKSNK